jgi:hypothetical protein
VIIYQIDRTGADNTPELLAAAAGPSVWSSPGDISKAIELAKSRRSAIYHLHDEAALSTGETDGEIRSAAVGLLRDVERLRLEGGRLIWSRSDRPGRDAAEAPLAELRAGLAQLATVQHLTSWAALEALGDARGPGRVVVFPHGGYVPHCRVWPGPRARKRLGIADETFVFMLFAGFSELSSDDLTAVRHALGALEASAHLIVAGAENLPDAVPSEHVTVIGETGGPADRVMPVAAADAVVIPRTSGYSSRTAVRAKQRPRGDRAGNPFAPWCRRK